ncbi:MAG: restriction endonuclease subunit S, partial [Chloroflexi bacterium]|nr:restriction endonuclease subunit S [Chloroflexota bacterium]
GKLLTFANGRSSPDRADDLQFPVYGSNGIIGYADEANADRGTIVIGRVGSYCGSLYLSDQRCWVTDNAIRATALENNDSQFLFYLLVTLHLNNWRAGSGQPLLNQDILGRIPASVPPLPEQRAIAHILGTLDDKIELNRRMNATLEEMARTLFKSWFVDFDPVRAKMEGRDTGLPAEIEDLFPDGFEESELGEVPRGWRTKGLDEIARFLNGLALQKYPPKDNRSLPVIKIAQLRAGNTDGADVASAELEPDYIVQDGDLLFSWSGSLECVIWAGGPGALNQHLFKVTSVEYPTWFCYMWLHQHLGDFRHIAAGKATTMGHIQRHHLSDAKVVLPPPKLLDAANGVIGPLIERTWHQTVQSRTLAMLRDALLPKLISGEVRVGDAEPFMRQMPAELTIKRRGNAE